MKVGITYNEKDEERQPKTKKVEWSLQDADEVDIDKEHPAYDIFTIKNGVVTINEEFIVSQEAEENTFRVKAVAMDYEREEGEEVTAYSEWITITNRKIILGDLVLVEARETEDGIVYDVVARSGQNAPIDKVDGSRAVILHKGTPERDTYTDEDFMYGAEEEDEEQAVLVYTSNKKEVEIDIIGTPAEGNEFIIGSCKYKNELVGVDELELIKEYAKVFGKGKKYHYYNFSKSGFTNGLKELAEKGEVRLVTLEDIYK